MVLPPPDEFPTYFIAIPLASVMSASSFEMIASLALRMRVFTGVGPG
jgi:hypothetical protein